MSEDHFGGYKKNLIIILKITILNNKLLYRINQSNK